MIYGQRASEQWIFDARARARDVEFFLRLKFEYV